jgi:proline iminopeptidase
LVLLLLTGCTSTRPFLEKESEVVPHSIASMESIPIGGIDESIWFRGVDTR